MKHLFLFVAAYFISHSLGAQNGENTPSSNFEKKISYSFNLGFPLDGGYGNNFEEALSNQGFDDTPDCWIFCPAKKHPHTHGNLYLAFNVNYDFHKYQSVGATIGMLNGFGFGKTSGFHEEYGNLDFDYDEFSLTTYYRFLDRSDIFIFEGGISGNYLSYRRIDGDAKFDKKTNYAIIRPGLMLGLQLKIRERENSFLRIGTQFHSMLGKVIVGPFKNEYFVGVYNEEQGIWTKELGVATTFQEEKISFNKFLIFVTYGFK